MKALVTTLAVGSFAAAASADQFFFEALIDGAQEVTPVATPATGTATGVYDDVTNEFSFEWSITDNLIGTPSAPGAHIHNAPVGVNGPIVFAMSMDAWPLDGNDVWSGLSQNEVDELFAGNLYFNFHTSQFPGGEVRGQILFIPTPSSLGVLALGGLVATRRRR